MEHLRSLRLSELVVRRARDHRAADARRAVDVEDATDGARGVDVGIGPEDVVGVDDVASYAARDSLRPGRVEVGDENRGTGARQMVGELPTDAAGALDEDAPSCQLV